MKPRAARFYSIAALLAITLAYVVVPQVARPTSAAVLRSHPDQTTTTNICGQVTAYVAATAGNTGTLTITTAGTPTTFTLAAGAIVGTAPTIGANQCFALTLNNLNQVTNVVVSQNNPTTQTVCGQVLGYTAPTSTANGSLIIGTTTYTIAAGATFSGTAITQGTNLCFQLTQNGLGQITSAGVTAYAPTTQLVCGPVSNFTAPTAGVAGTNGAITIGGTPYTIVAGANFTGAAVANGATLCFQLTINGAGQITGAAVTANAPATQIVCGQVLGYTAATTGASGSLTIGTTTFTLAPGATITGTTILTGSSLCFQLTQNGLGQVTAATVAANTPSTQTICGLVSNYTTAGATTNGAITIGTTTFTIVAGTALTGAVANGAVLCFTLTLNGAGQITAGAATAATTATVTPTATPTATATATSTATPTATATATSTATATATATAAPAPAPTNTPVPPKPTATPRAPTGPTGPARATPTATSIPIPAGQPHTGLGGSQAHNAVPRAASVSGTTQQRNTPLGITMQPRSGGGGSPSLPLLPLFGAMLTGAGVLVRRLTLAKR